jgi:hypothetical protein
LLSHENVSHGTKWKGEKIPVRWAINSTHPIGSVCQREKKKGKGKGRKRRTNSGKTKHTQFICPEASWSREPMGVGRCSGLPSSGSA